MEEQDKQCCTPRPTSRCACATLKDKAPAVDRGCCCGSDCGCGEACSCPSGCGCKE